MALPLRILPILLLFAVLHVSWAGCPFTSKQSRGDFPSDSKIRTTPTRKASIPRGGFEAVRKDILNLLTDSQDFWPADFGNYGPLMIRLSWHCAGSYRTSDGRGGCDGARITQFPEFGWPDNANLDKAMRLLEPIKEKYGDSLSMGDLIALTGDVSITSMGGPSIGFCGGRIDDADGSASLTLGPSEEQEAVAPCEVNGKCDFPLGPTTVGLIYVNPGGPLGNGDPSGSVADIRRSFGTMGMNDKETVALIGGGHAFGKVHGACPTGPGPGPLERPNDPWPGTCGTPGTPLFGRGPNTATSGFEGPWTTRPTTWSNDYFTSLLEFTWVEVIGPGGELQWRPQGLADEDGGFVRMLTTDIALLRDEKYLSIVKQFAANITSLEENFAEAWYKLVTRDMGPVTRCIGDDVPAARPFQRPLPEPTKAISPLLVKKASILIKKAIFKQSSRIAPDNIPEGRAYYGALLVNLAYQCASSYRDTDHLGGCNGATIRFAPERNFAGNQGASGVIRLLRDVRRKLKGKLSISDMIVLAGNVALQEAGSKPLKFCSGRTDAVRSDELQVELANLAPRSYVPDPIVSVRDSEQVMGLGPYDTVALAGRLRSPSQQKRLGFSGSYTRDPSTFDNGFYKTLLRETWKPVVKGDIAPASFGLDTEFKAVGKNIFITGRDLVLIKDPIYLKIVKKFAASEKKFQKSFKSAWTTLMNADRFDGPDSNVCN